MVSFSAAGPQDGYWGKRAAKRGCQPGRGGCSVVARNGSKVPGILSMPVRLKNIEKKFHFLMCINAETKSLQPLDFLAGTIGREVYKRVSKALLINWLQKRPLDFILRLE